MAEETERKQPFWKTAVVPVVVALISIGGTVGGMFLQDRFDLLGTQRELVVKYMEDAETSASGVEEVIADIFNELSNPDGQLSRDAVRRLRDAMLSLRRTSERVAIQTDSTDGEFQNFSSSMSNLVDVAYRTTGPADADELVEAIGAFLASKRQFENEVATLHRPRSG